MASNRLSFIRAKLPPLPVEYDRDAVGKLVLAIERNFANLIRLPEFLSGIWTEIDTYTASAGSELEFDSVFSDEYPHYAILIQSLYPATDATDLYAQVSADGTTYATDYQFGFAPLDASVTYGYGVSYAPTTGQAASQITLATSLSSTAANALSGLIWVDDPGTAGKLKIRSYLSYTNSSGNWTHIDGGGLNDSAAAITSLRLYMSSGNITANTKLYGVAP